MATPNLIKNFEECLLPSQGNCDRCICWNTDSARTSDVLGFLVGIQDVSLAIQSPPGQLQQPNSGDTITVEFEDPGLNITLTFTINAPLISTQVQIGASALQTWTEFSKVLNSRIIPNGVISKPVSNYLGLGFGGIAFYALECAKQDGTFQPGMPTSISFTGAINLSYSLPSSSTPAFLKDNYFLEVYVSVGSEQFGPYQVPLKTKKLTFDFEAFESGNISSCRGLFYEDELCLNLDSISRYSTSIRAVPPFSNSDSIVTLSPNSIKDLGLFWREVYSDSNGITKYGEYLSTSLPPLILAKCGCIEATDFEPALGPTGSPNEVTSTGICPVPPTCIRSGEDNRITGLGNIAQYEVLSGAFDEPNGPGFVWGPGNLVDTYEVTSITVTDAFGSTVYPVPPGTIDASSTGASSAASDTPHPSLASQIVSYLGGLGVIVNLEYVNYKSYPEFENIVGILPESSFVYFDNSQNAKWVSSFDITRQSNGATGRQILGEYCPNYEQQYFLTSRGNNFDLESPLNQICDTTPFFHYIYLKAGNYSYGYFSAAPGVSGGGLFTAEKDGLYFIDHRFYLADIIDAGAEPPFDATFTISPDPFISLSLLTELVAFRYLDPSSNECCCTQDFVFLSCNGVFERIPVQCDASYSITVNQESFLDCKECGDNVAKNVTYVNEYEDTKTTYSAQFENSEENLNLIRAFLTSPEIYLTTSNNRNAEVDPTLTRVKIIGTEILIANAKSKFQLEIQYYEVDDKTGILNFR
jgi:hypothetical protein